MSCCGSQRAAQRHGAVSSGRSAAAPFVTSSLEFEYTGSGQIQVTGPMTGAIYTFNGTGDRVLVHSADVASVATVPALRPVR